MTSQFADDRVGFLAALTAPAVGGTHRHAPSSEEKKRRGAFEFLWHEHQPTFKSSFKGSCFLCPFGPSSGPLYY